MVLEVALHALTGITIILVVGLLVSFFAQRIKVANVLLLLFVGMVFGFLQQQGLFSFEFSELFIVTLALLTLVLVVFDGSSRFKLRLVNTYSTISLKIFLFYLFFALLVLSPLSAWLFFDTVGPNTLLLSALFAITMAGTDPTSMFHILKSSGNRVIQTLEIESIINTPFTVILPFIVLEIIVNTSQTISSIVVNQLAPLILQIAAGVGLGVVLGYFLPRLVARFSAKDYAPIFVVTFALVGYLLAETIGGSGILCVATMGLFFGKIPGAKRESMQNFNRILTSIFVILVFILVGFIIPVSFSLWFLLKIFVVFVVAVCLRFFALRLALPAKRFTMQETIFMALLIPKGIAVAVVVLSLSLFAVAQTQPLLATIAQIIVMSTLLSLIVATILARFDNFFLKRAHQEEVELQRKTKSLQQQKEKIEKKLQQTKKKVKDAKKVKKVKSKKLKDNKGAKSTKTNKKNTKNTRAAKKTKVAKHSKKARSS